METHTKEPTGEEHAKGGKKKKEKRKKDNIKGLTTPVADLKPVTQALYLVKRSPYRREAM